MDKNHQVGLMLGAVEDYQTGTITLGLLIQKIRGILAAVDDTIIENDLFNSYAALEEIYAMTTIGNFDFEKIGRPIVDRALNDIVVKTSLITFADRN